MARVYSAFALAALFGSGAVATGSACTGEAMFGIAVDSSAETGGSDDSGSGDSGSGDSGSGDGGSGDSGSGDSGSGDSGSGDSGEVYESYSAINIYPEHVGVLTVVGTQQFVAYGVRGDGSLVNISRDVDWLSSDSAVVTIDGNGLAAIATGVTSGLAEITSSYPRSSAPAQNMATTSLTVVHIDDHRTTWIDPMKWPSWPISPDAKPPGAATPLEPNGQGVYLSNLVVAATHVSWSTSPAITPYPAYPNTINSMIAAVWSENNGKTFSLSSWDWLANNTHYKPASYAKDCWVGTMVHSICDAGGCNGSYRSNIYFAKGIEEFPDPVCWAAAVMK